MSVRNRFETERLGREQFFTRRLESLTSPRPEVHASVKGAHQGQVAAGQALLVFTDSECRKVAPRPSIASWERRSEIDGTRKVNQMADASELIDERIKELGDWRGKKLSQVRRIIRETDPGIVEEWKWAKSTNPGTPVWSRNGGICTGETYKNLVKLTFFKGAALPDPSGLFNSSLEGKVRRAIDIKENDEIDEMALRNLIGEAVALNLRK